MKEIGQWKSLEEVIKSLSPGADFQTTVELFRIYLKELNKWNKVINLTSVSSLNNGVIRHIFDSLAALDIIRSLPHKCLADAGSGAGLPGLPLALFLRESEIVLIERSSKRAAFLRNMVILLDLEHRVKVAEKNLKDIINQYDIVVFRAFGKLEKVIYPLFKILKPEGTLVAYKGKKIKIREELKIISETAGETNIIPVKVPFLDEERHIVLIRKKDGC